MNSASDVESLAEALVEATDQLLGLYELNDVTSRSLDENQVVDDVLERALRIVPADRLTLTTTTGEVSVGQHCFETECSFTSVGATHGLGLEGELHAVRRGSPFSTGDRKLLQSVLRTTLTAIETAKLHSRAIEAALVARETQRAGEIAQMAMPSERPHLDGVDVFFENRQTHHTGGDLFCFHVEGDLLRFAVGDVSGKDLSAGVMMTTAVCAARAAFRDSRASTPGEELSLVNDWMFDHLSEAGLFISMFIGHYRAGDTHLRWANAGHSPCVLSTVRGATDLIASTPPLGVLERIDDSVRTTELSDGDIVFIGTDGLIEQADPSGRMFGERRLHGVLAAAREDQASVIGAAVFTSVKRFADPTPQSDDQTVVILRHGDRPAAGDLTLPAGYRHLRKLRPWLATQAPDLDESELGRIELCLQELAANVIDHAGAAEFTVRAAHSSGQLVIEIHDRGAPMKESTTALVESHPRVRGYGLMIAEQLASDLAYERQSTINVWRATFDLAP